MKRFLDWLEIPIHAFLWVGLVGGILMMLHVTADVAGRTIFNHPIEGTTEIVSAYYMVAVAYLPWAWIARHDRHIHVDMFTIRMSPRPKFWLEIAVKVVTLLYVGLFTWRTTLRAISQTRAGEDCRNQLHSGLAEPLGPSDRRGTHGRLPRRARDFRRSDQVQD